MQLICTKCKEPKGEDDFYNCGGWCKQCRRLYQRQYWFKHKIQKEKKRKVRYENNKEALRERHKLYMRKLREKEKAAKESKEYPSETRKPVFEFTNGSPFKSINLLNERTEKRGIKLQIGGEKELNAVLIPPEEAKLYVKWLTFQLQEKL